MGIYRKKPVEIEARLLTSANAYDIVKWIELHGGLARVEKGEHLEIQTLEGIMRADFDVDMIIQGIENEFYPCKLDIFTNSYDYISG